MSIATVVSITGQAWARDEQGNLRELSVGDTLQEGEVLVTSDNGSVQLDFGDGLEPTQIPGGQTVAMTPELNDEAPVDETDFAAMDEDIDALLTALEEEDGDLLEALDATAAGAGGGGGAGGGHDFVRLARISEDVDPLAFTFAGAATPGPEFDEDFAPADVEEDAEVIAPTANASTIELQDAETVGESASVATGVLDYSFGSGGAGSVTFAGMDGTQLQVGRELLQFSWDGDSNTLFAVSPGRESLVFTVEVDPTTGEFTATQVSNLLHEESLDEALAGLTFTVTSGDGSTADGDFDITILDDLPSITEFSTGDLDELTLTTFDVATGEGGYPPREIPQQEVALEPGQDDFPGNDQPLPWMPNSASQSLASFFDASINYGADGPGSAEWSYGLSLTSGEGDGSVDSGLTTGDETIYLHEVEGPNGSMGIVGSTNSTPPEAGGELPSDVVFLLAIDGEGEEASITLMQFQAIDHPEGGEPGQTISIPSDLITLTGTLTVTDADDDSVSASQDIDLASLINFVDDEPEIIEFDTTEADLAVDESLEPDTDTDPNAGDETAAGAPEGAIGYATLAGDELFDVSVDGGADGENDAARSFALNLALAEEASSVDSGLDVTGGGNILLSMDGSDVVGRDSQTESEVFRIEIDAETGAVTVTQYQAIDHGEDGNDHDAGLSIDPELLSAELTIEDNDGDSDSQSVELGSLITFEDDGPSAQRAELGQDDAPVVSLDESPMEGEGNDGL
ncbi:retention module-containing protein, partial [Halomonas sp. NO4]|uniref:retention module-containing protein n=1 Tax=Halomonas sp. NO4 TaxID=2484813 RepID=UPI0013D4D298